jgi:NAD(P)-dependent dehydrogenase (short-subunit alcohol dehydrogenase family)
MAGFLEAICPQILTGSRLGRSDAVRANAVAPGVVRTPINRPAWETSESYRRLMTLVPYKRIGGPEDIA